MAKSTLSYPNKMAIAGEMPELAMEVYSFFCQGFSEDLPHHTARIFAQARVAR